MDEEQKKRLKKFVKRPNWGDRPKTETWYAKPTNPMPVFNIHDQIQTLRTTIREQRTEITRLEFESAALQTEINALKETHKRRIHTLLQKINQLEANILQLEPQRWNPKIKDTELLL